MESFLLVQQPTPDSGVHRVLIRHNHVRIHQEIEQAFLLHQQEILSGTDLLKVEENEAMAGFRKSLVTTETCILEPRHGVVVFVQRATRDAGRTT